MLTIFTPTYNRGYCLENLFNSLKNQTTFDFEWIIVDDGSTDNSEEIITKFKNSCNLFDIIYIKAKHGGKHRAINIAVNKAKGKYFFIVDSDDVIEKDAVEIIINTFDTIKNKEMFAGIAGCKGYIKKDQIIGSTFNGEYIDATSLEREKNNIYGDKAEVFYTDLLKKYPFPEFENEFFLSEDVIWKKIAYDGYKIRWFNKIIYRVEYLNDGLSKNLIKNYNASPHGYIYYIKTEIDYKNFNILKKLITYGRCYDTLKNNSEITINDIVRLLNTNKINIYLGYIIFLIRQYLK